MNNLWPRLRTDMNKKTVALLYSHPETLAIVLALLATPNLLCAGVYKCKDANGNTVYSDSACSGKESTEMRVDRAPEPAPTVTPYKPVDTYTQQKNTSPSTTDEKEYLRKRRSLTEQIGVINRNRQELKNEIAKEQRPTGQSFNLNFKKALDMKLEIQKLELELQELDKEWSNKTRP